jgi:hypothetical protein
LLLGVVVFPVASQIRSPDRECDFHSYHPLKIGTPIRGGHEDLAIERVTPTYPEQAQQNGIGGQVDAQVLINRAGDVIKVCASGEPLLLLTVEEAVSRWKFQRDFGFTFTRGRPAADYAVLRLSFDFNPVSENRACRMQLRLAEQTGFPVMLSSYHLIRIANHRVMPKTPSSCRCEGVVQVRLLIDASGEVKCIEPGPGHPLLVYSALETLRQWRFQPFVHRGVPVPYVGELSVRFSAGRTGVFAKIEKKS